MHVHRTAVFFIFLRGHIDLLHSLLRATSGIAAVPESFSGALGISASDSFMLTTDSEV